MAEFKDVLKKANDGYHDRKDYPPFAKVSWDDRNKWSDYLEKINDELDKKVKKLPTGNYRLEALTNQNSEFLLALISKLNGLTTKGIKTHINIDNDLLCKMLQLLLNAKLIKTDVFYSVTEEGEKDLKKIGLGK